ESYKDLIDPKKPKSFPFRPGMSASADIQTRTHVNVLSVPINSVATREKGTDNAVLDANNNTPDNPGNNNSTDTKPVSATGDLDEVVFVLTGDTVRKAKVRTDIQDINYIEVVDGLKEGDQIITGPYSVVSKTLKGGLRVKVVPKDKLFEGKKD
ncbi:MAG TPA: efflux RND transporter periplasmic adaptor subunit, partial [Puia sp.]|nr:efflux RND transporter periplasmic adaptor subunit [Puia sp.]